MYLRCLCIAGGGFSLLGYPNFGGMVHQKQKEPPLKMMWSPMMYIYMYQM